MSETQAVTNTPEAKNIIENALAKISLMRESGELRIPKDYSPENAIRAAMIVISETKDKSGKTALEVCTRPSIANAMLKMVVWGLSPLKKQCDFIVYGNELTCSPEYTGQIAMAKRYGGLKSVKGNCIFKGDVFEFAIDPDTGRRVIIKHEQTLESIASNDFIGAYAVTELEDGTRDVEVMSRRQIEQAWNQGAMKGNSPAHKNFPDQMAIKTVITRACKLLIRGSDDSVLFDENENLVKESPAKAEVRQEIGELAHKKTIQIQPKEPVKQELPKAQEIKVPEPVLVEAGQTEMPLVEEEKDPF